MGTLDPLFLDPKISQFFTQKPILDANKMGPLDQVSDDFIMFTPNYDHGLFPNFEKNIATTSNNNYVELKDNTFNANNVVVELKDDTFNANHVVLDDDECVFVKKERNLLPRGKNKSDPICVDGYNCVKSEKGMKLEKKSGVVVDIDDGDHNVVHCVKSEKGVRLGKKSGVVDVDDYDDVDCDVEVRILNVTPTCKRRRRKKPFRGISVTEVGESSGSKKWGNVVAAAADDDDEMVVEIAPPPEVMFLCEICADSKPKKQCFKIKGCSHSYCSECMTSYVASKLQDGVSIVICPDPGCPGVLEPEYCREILPFEVFSRWGNLLCESVILASQKFYCPFKDCSALLIDDGGEAVTKSECPSCFRLFCAQCKVGWHEGVACAEFQSLSKDERNKEDIMLRKLAKEQNWQRCPTCKYYVQKSEGCLYMKCRCGVAFCYSCGAINHDHRYHYCKKCGR